MASTALAAAALGASRSLLALSGADLRERLAADPLRPQFHLLPAANWVNDPNAPIYWKGHYHLFYQYNPHASVWGDMHWAHSVSEDMVHWKHLPGALAPTVGGPDEDGCFSGSAIVDRDRVVVFYTGVVKATDDATLRDGNSSLRESQCMAVSHSADLSSWVKDPIPVIPRPPEGIKVTGFRDPSVWREGRSWYMIVGSGVEGRGGAILLYRSSDLKQWSFQHILISGKKNSATDPNPVATGEMWECPDLFRLGNKHVLIYSTEGKVLWQSGVLDPGTMLFHGEEQGILDHGSFYAPKTQLDARGNRILWGWIPETRPVEQYRAAGWAGLMSLPRTLTLGADGRLRIACSAALDVLRGEKSTSRGTEGEPRELTIPRASGEVSLKATGLQAGLEMALVLDRSAAAGGENPVLSIKYEPSSRQLLLDEKKVTMRAGDARELSIRIFVDGSVMEVFLNGSEAYTKRFYYPGAEAPDIGVRLLNFRGSLGEFAVWPMKAISPDRLTRPPD